MDSQKLDRLQNIIDDSSRIVFFGGAGVSTESGIPDFRSQDGLYNQKYQYPPEVMISRSFYDSHKEEFFRFYRDKMIYTDARPNPAHLRLAQLEQAGKLLSVVTQNIDGLHQQAGSERVWELHGSVQRNYCRICGKEYGLEMILSGAGVPVCACGGEVKPDVVLYEEGLNTQVIEGAVGDISRADTLIIGGTSLVVYPAAGLVDYFTGKHLVVINKSSTSQESRAELVINDPIGAVFDALVV